MILTEIPRAITRKLKAETFFQSPVPIPVVAMCDKDIFAVLEHALGSLGIVVVVQVTAMGDVKNYCPGTIQVDNITIAVNIREQLEINRTGALGTGIACETLVEYVASVLSGAVLSDSDGNKLAFSPLMFLSAEQTEDPDESLYSWALFFQTKGLIKASDMTQSNQQEPQPSLP